MAADAGVAVACRKLNSVDGFAERSDLFHLDQNAVRNLFIDTALQSLDVGDEQIVADQLNLVAQAIGQLLPSRPIVF